MQPIIHPVINILISYLPLSSKRITELFLDNNKLINQFRGGSVTLQHEGVYIFPFKQIQMNISANYSKNRPPHAPQNIRWQLPVQCTLCSVHRRIPGQPLSGIDFSQSMEESRFGRIKVEILDRYDKNILLFYVDSSNNDHSLPMSKLFLHKLHVEDFFF